MDQETATRIVIALEGIQAELARVTFALNRMWEEPNFAPMGLAVVDKGSPEARRQMLAQGTLRRPGQ